MYARPRRFPGCPTDFGSKIAGDGALTTGVVSLTGRVVSDSVGLVMCSGSPALFPEAQIWRGLSLYL